MRDGGTEYEKGKNQRWLVMQLCLFCRSFGAEYDRTFYPDYPDYPDYSDYEGIADRLLNAPRLLDTPGNDNIREEVTGLLKTYGEDEKLFLTFGFLDQLQISFKQIKDTCGNLQQAFIKYNEFKLIIDGYYKGLTDHGPVLSGNNERLLNLMLDGSIDTVEHASDVNRECIDRLLFPEYGKKKASGSLSNKEIEKLRIALQLGDSPDSQSSVASSSESSVASSSASSDTSSSASSDRSSSASSDRSSSTSSSTSNSGSVRELGSKDVDCVRPHQHDGALDCSRDLDSDNGKGCVDSICKFLYDCAFSSGGGVALSEPLMNDCGRSSDSEDEGSVSSMFQSFDSEDEDLAYDDTVCSTTADQGSPVSFSGFDSN